mgnify:CR=1 FL=1
MFKIGDIVLVDGKTEHTLHRIHRIQNGVIYAGLFGDYRMVTLDRLQLVTPTTIEQNYTVGDHVHYLSEDGEPLGEYSVRDVTTGTRLSTGENFVMYDLQHASSGNTAYCVHENRMSPVATYSLF